MRFALLLTPFALAAMAGTALADAGAAPPAPAAAAPAAAPVAAPSPEVAKAKAAIKGFADKLRGELVGAMQSGGPVAAIETCRAVAPGIAKDASAPADGFVIGRTALKVRNSQNKPDAFEKKVLEDFVAKIKGGADPATLEHTEEVEQNGVKHVRFMKAIPMAEAPCMACHGPSEKIDPAAAAKIKQLYPSDEAVGFKPGELRGAFTVTIKK